MEGDFLSNTRVAFVNDNKIDIYDISRNSFDFVFTFDPSDLFPSNSSQDIFQIVYSTQGDCDVLWVTSAAGLLGFCPGTLLTRDPVQTSLSGGAIAGIVLGLIFFSCCSVALITGLIFWYFSSKIQKNQTAIYSAPSEDVELDSQRDPDPSLNVPVLYDIVIGKRLGSGNFGEVFQGNWNSSTPVALKSLKGENMKEFAQELAILLEMRHPQASLFFKLYLPAS